MKVIHHILLDIKSLLEWAYIKWRISSISKHSFVGSILYCTCVKYNYILPKHGFSFPELILQHWDEASPNEIVQTNDVYYIDNENSSALGVLNREAIFEWVISLLILFEIKKFYLSIWKVTYKSSISSSNF